MADDERPAAQIDEQEREGQSGQKPQDGEEEQTGPEAPEFEPPKRGSAESSANTSKRTVPPCLIVMAVGSAYTHVMSSGSRRVHALSGFAASNE